MESQDFFLPPAYHTSAHEPEVPMGGTAKGMKGFYVELQPALIAAFRDYADGRGETMRDAVARAMRREMANPPPPVVDPPFPPMPELKPKKRKAK